MIVRYLTNDLSGLTIACLRLYVAALALLVIMRVYRYPIRIPIRDKYFLITVAATVANYLFFHVGLEHTTASNAMVLENTAPFFVLVFLVLFFKQRIRPIEYLASIIAVFGVFFTVSDDFQMGGESLSGDIMELGAGLTWAVFMMASSKALASTQGTLERVCFLFGVFLVSAVIMTPFLFMYPPRGATFADAGFLVLLGVFPTAIAYYLWYEAAARVSTVSAALFFTLTVVFTFLNAWFFLGEGIDAKMLIGACLIVVGVILSKIKSDDRFDAEAPS